MTVVERGKIAIMAKGVLPSVRLAMLAWLVCWPTLGRGADCVLEKVADLHVAVDNGRILIPATIKGRKVRFLLDTAFPSNVMSTSTARQLGLAINRFGDDTFINDAPSHNSGLMTFDEGGTVDIDRLQLDGLTLKDARLAAFNSTSNFGAPDIVGTLGSDLWRAFDVQVDLSRNLVTLFHLRNCAGQDVAPWGEAYNVLDLAPSGQLTAFKVKVNGRELSAVLDSGSPHSSLTEGAADRIGVGQPDVTTVFEDAVPTGVQASDLPSLIRFSHGYGMAPHGPNIARVSLPDLGMALPRRYWPMRLDTFEMDREVISSMSMRVVPVQRVLAKETGTRTPRNLASYDVLLGVDFLQSHRVLFARSQNKLYFLYTGDVAFVKP